MNDLLSWNPNIKRYYAVYLEKKNINKVGYGVGHDQIFHCRGGYGQKVMRSLGRPCTKTFGWPQGSKSSLAEAVLSWGEELLTWVGDIVVRWIEHFKELLNLTNAFSIEEV